MSSQVTIEMPTFHITYSASAVQRAASFIANALGSGGFVSHENSVTQNSGLELETAWRYLNAARSIAFMTGRSPSEMSPLWKAWCSGLRS